MQVKLLAFAGSTRKESFNKKLVQIAIKGARNAGADVTYLDLKEHPRIFKKNPASPKLR
jgi:NAD(P)H-dependent FMN reductase